MVAIDTVRAANASLKSGQPGLVALFVGATKGIGAATLRQLTKNLKAPTIYIVGRSKGGFSSQLSELKTLNPDASFEFLETEISLVENVDWISKKLKETESKLDLLFMSPGILPIGGPTYNAEGIDVCMSLSYYARIRLTINLLPLLQNSASPRVLSVLAGGQERRLFTYDLALKHNYSFLNVIDQVTTMHTLIFERLAYENRKIIFIHSYPGWVQTDIAQTAWLSGPHRPRWLVSLVSWVIGLLFRLLATSVEESGERYVFQATSMKLTSTERRDSQYGKQALVHLVDAKCENASTRSNQKVLDRYRREGMVEKVWCHTMNVFADILSNNGISDKVELERRPKID